MGRQADADSGGHFGAHSRGQPASHEVRFHAWSPSQECFALFHETAVHDGGVAGAPPAHAAVRRARPGNPGADLRQFRPEYRLRLARLSAVRLDVRRPLPVRRTFDPARARGHHTPAGGLRLAGNSLQHRWRLLPELFRGLRRRGLPGDSVGPHGVGPGARELYGARQCAASSKCSSAPRPSCRTAA